MEIYHTQEKSFIHLIIVAIFIKQVLFLISFLSPKMLHFLKNGNEPMHKRILCPGLEVSAIGRVYGGYLKSMAKEMIKNP